MHVAFNSSLLHQQRGAQYWRWRDELNMNIAMTEQLLARRTRGTVYDKGGAGEMHTTSGEGATHFAVAVIPSTGAGAAQTAAAGDEDGTAGAGEMNSPTGARAPYYAVAREIYPATGVGRRALLVLT